MPAAFGRGICAAADLIENAFPDLSAVLDPTYEQLADTEAKTELLRRMDEVEPAITDAVTAFESVPPWPPGTDAVGYLRESLMLYRESLDTFRIALESGDYGGLVDAYAAAKDADAELELFGAALERLRDGDPAFRCP
ncbi:MAG TPA: hypothetical protein VJZ72_06220 [Candidatus Limnocylindrales bacterium]|nr:hypothetical protein [Candidatus Limnocylindrales bacterium]